MIDLVGLGALNLDLIVSGSARASLAPSISADIAHRFPVDGERPATRDEIFTLISAIASHATTSLGGSSFNTVRTIAAVTDDLALGFVGCLGALSVGLPKVRSGFVPWFESHKIDCQFVRRIPDELPGIAISVMNRGDRQLLTHSGANEHFADVITDFGQEVVDYLCSARLLHLTSIFDDRSAKVLLRLLARVREASPGTLISFDPGHYWVHNPTPDILALYRYADFLFLNNQECFELGGLRGDDHSLAREIVHEIVGQDCLVFAKRPHEIGIFIGVGGGVTETYVPNPVLDEAEIVDATGAGDVFAGGVLAGWLLGIDELSISVEFALTLVRAKLVERGPDPTYAFREIALRTPSVREAAERPRLGRPVRTQRYRLKKMVGG